MKQKYSVGIFILFLMVLLFVTGSQKFAKIQESEEQEIEQEEPLQSSVESVVTDGHALKEDCFFLKEANGYVVVYFSDGKTVYEYTDISFEELPEKVKKEVNNGKYIENQEELYGFLENYSS